MIYSLSANILQRNPSHPCNWVLNIIEIIIVETDSKSLRSSHTEAVSILLVLELFFRIIRIDIIDYALLPKGINQCNSIHERIIF